MLDEKPFGASRGQPLMNKSNRKGQYKLMEAAFLYPVVVKCQSWNHKIDSWEVIHCLPPVRMSQKPLVYSLCLLDRGYWLFNQVL